MAAASKTSKTPTFQERLDDLKGVVEKLETGDLALEDAIERFEAGRKLHRELLEELSGFEKRLEKLMQEPAGEGQRSGVQDQGDGRRGDK